MCFFPMWKLGYTPKKENAEVFYLKEKKNHQNNCNVSPYQTYSICHYSKISKGVFHEDETSRSNP